LAASIERHALGLKGARPLPGVVAWTEALWLALVIVLVADTLAAARIPHLGIDPAATALVRAVPWPPPLLTLMRFSNSLTAQEEIVVALAAGILLVFINRRAALLLPVAALASAGALLLKYTVHRPAAEPGALHLYGLTVGNTYPSGHATFAAWLLGMVAWAIASRSNSRLRPFVWTLAAIGVLLVAGGRVWGGFHWLSDVVGGVLLGVVWTALVLKTGRRLGDPVRK
jgi:membrane-associated phospholipid phosphatase